MLTESDEKVVTGTPVSCFNTPFFFARFSPEALSAMLGLVRDKFAKTKKVETDDVKLLTAHFAGGGFISKDMIGVIVFSKLTAPCFGARSGQR